MHYSNCCIRTLCHRAPNFPSHRSSDEFHLHYAQNSLMFWLPPANCSFQGGSSEIICADRISKINFSEIICVCASAQYLNASLLFEFFLLVDWRNHQQFQRKMLNNAPVASEALKFWLIAFSKLKALKIILEILSSHRSQGVDTVEMVVRRCYD